MAGLKHVIMNKYCLQSGLSLTLLIFSLGCNSSQKESDKTSVNEPNTGISISNGQIQDLNQVTVLEVIQVPNYTYLRVKQGVEEFWIAAPGLVTKPGDNLYYKGGMIMAKFESKELSRTFEKILFVEKISADPTAIAQLNLTTDPQSGHPTIEQQGSTDRSSSIAPVRQTIEMEPAKNGITIAALLKKPELFAGKKVMIRGKITKYTPGVMGTNWVHIQDGTDFQGKFEVVITTKSELHDGETVTFEGSVTLNKDLGFGYFFDVLIEDAQIVK
jgi:hypothetical protein